MTTVLFVGIVASALAGGAVVGWIFSQREEPAVENINHVVK